MTALNTARLGRVDPGPGYSYIASVLRYEDGKLFWLRKRGSKASGSRAGYQSVGGYRFVRINKVLCLEHRIVWLLHRGVLPNFIDHINGVKNDNRIENLREATKSQNAANSRVMSESLVPFKGVHFYVGKYCAAISCNGQRYYLGRHKTAVEAAKAYDRKATELFGEYAMTNNSLGLIRSGVAA
jgi:hypothetical protein